uniref:Uncharacterized protein n=1 Tax=Anguilla anguilla TaxID=7936 RepID=A0A0E9RMM5_ANGAN
MAFKNLQTLLCSSSMNTIREMK